MCEIINPACIMTPYYNDAHYYSANKLKLRIKVYKYLNMKTKFPFFNSFLCQTAAKGFAIDRIVIESIESTGTMVRLKNIQRKVRFLIDTTPNATTIRDHLFPQLGVQQEAYK